MQTTVEINQKDVKAFTIVNHANGRTTRYTKRELSIEARIGRKALREQGRTFDRETSWWQVVIAGDSVALQVFAIDQIDGKQYVWSEAI
jgi:hypothetical protein